ncbi:MAG: hydantoinase B/oxoprolinase family protein [Alphaproteobacteria bacterium]|nr:hydantoinase B/oxoprolinase family protein [Alphaproteobacteria bacterium]
MGDRVGAFTFVDRGGTFTDVVTWRPGHAPTMRKVRSDEAVVGDLREGQLTLGTTVATNALLERAGVPTLLVVTRGFGDLVRLRHMARPSLFDPDAAWPEPLCARVLELDGRLDAHGDEVAPLALDGLAAALEGMAAVAVCLLHAWASPVHEHAVAAAIGALAPDLHVALGHRASPEVGYLARLETTLVDAAITPVLQAALRRDRVAADDLAIRSDGGLVAAPALRAPQAVLSGPAGGVLAVAEIARQAGLPGAVGLDMGGTSTDVCLVLGDALPRVHADRLVAGVSVRAEQLEVETIAAGGGSVCWHDGTRLRVGPRSAGADPGPQCYGRGGPPTVTDAALVAGLIDPAAFAPPLDAAAVALPAPAEAFLDVAREEMAAAVRRLAVARGVDLAELALVAYGGAAGQHAAEVAARLGMRTVLVHPFAAVLSAWGQALARPERTAAVALWVDLDAAWDEVEAAAATIRRTLDGPGDLALSLRLRPRGTDHALEVALGDGPDAARRAYGATHATVHGVRWVSGPLEVVDVSGRRAAPRLAHPPAVDEDWGLGGRPAVGPLRLDRPTTSVVVPAGWTARVARGLLVLTHEAAVPRPAVATRTAHGLALWASRFSAVATQSGELLARLARSVNIRERRDFSCAVFDEGGQLVANAPHVPVHLGALGVTVRDLHAHVPDAADGSAWLTNAPDAGGSHLPDLSVITPVIHDGRRFFVACRAHHADIGGLTPGSMPPHSRALVDEGLCFRREPLLEGGRLRPLDRLLEGARDPGLVRDDLQAQIAANALAARLLRALGPADLLAAWMGHLQDAADEAVRDRVRDLPEGQAGDHLDGLPLRVAVQRTATGARVDFTGTGGPHPGNLNAPPAVVRAAVLYALRVLLAEDVPLNEGALRSVEIVLPSPSLLHPPPDAAVVGGNVETSQRVVDLLLRAWGARAASQGTMNNLTLGGPDWSHYETLGGGQGASPSSAGASGRQVHMTNTRATDPEVLEVRLPVRVIATALRSGSGGAGTHPGGDGLVRELEVLAPATAALLATRRRSGAPGLGGGEDGLPGADALRRGGSWSAWAGDPTPLAPGDRVRVATPGGGGWGRPPRRDA